MTRLFLLSIFLILAGTRVQCQSEALRAQASSVVLSYDVIYRVESPSSATVAYKKSVLLLNDKHRGENVLSEYFNNDIKLSTTKIAAVDAFGRETFSSKKSDWRDERITSQGNLYEDRWRRTIVAPCNTYPCTIDIEVERKLSGFGVIQFPDWLPQDLDQSVMAASFTAYVPLENELLYSANKLPPPVITTENRQRIYSWSVTDIPALRGEPLAPFPTEILPFLALGLKNFEVDNYQGSFSDWKSFGNFINTIMEGRDHLPDQLALQVREITATAANDREKIQLLYQFMQSRMRYVSIQLGIGGWQPFSAEYVEKNRYGDCKALSNYMGAMLKEVGIESYPVLITLSKVPFYAVEENFATSAFNHMVLYIPSQDMYLECTSNDYPTDYFGEAKQDRNALWITPDGGKLMRTPKLDPTDNGYIRTVGLDLEEGKQVAFDLHATYFGAEQEIHRDISSYYGSRTEQLSTLHRLGYLPDVSGDNYKYTVESGEARADLTYRTTLSNHIKKLGTRTFLPINPTPYNEIPERVEDRRLPVETNQARFFVDTINIKFTTDYEIESGDFNEPIEYSYAGNEYRAKLLPQPDGVKWVRTLKLVPVALPAEQYVDYRQFFVDVSKAERMQLVLKERKTK